MKNFTYLVMHRMVEVWVPHRISGFFQMMDPTIEVPKGEFVKIGSRGGGPSLSAYGKTKITLLSVQNSNFDENTPTSYCKILINNKECTVSAKTSLSVITQMKGLLPSAFFLNIEHYFDLPSGCGYGSSGAGALGLSIGLNDIFQLGLTELEAAKFAHIAEVINHTGLGTVGGQFTGGLSITLEPGYPFQMKKIDVPDDIKIIVGSFGPISTKKILTDMKYRIIIHNSGKKAMIKMRSNFTLQNYMDVCSEFLEETDLLNKLNLKESKDLIDALKSLKIYGASMNQLGNSIFCICKENEVDGVFQEFKKHQPSFTLQCLDICNNGTIIKKRI
jgi:pantoate kinase